MKIIYKWTALFAVLFITTSSYASKYSVTDLGTLSGIQSSADSINEAGQIVGQSDGHAFLWENGTMTDLGTNGGVSSSARDINENGVITGWTVSAGNVWTPFRYSGSTMTPLDTGTGNFSNAYAINDYGIIAGRSYSSGNIRATIWNNAGARTLLGTLGGSSYAYAINNQGQVVGHSYSGGYRHAFLWENGTMHDLGTALGIEAYTHDINESSQIAGYYKLANGTYNAFLWDEGYTYIDPLTSAESTVATAVNDNTQVVGYSGDYAFLWDEVNGTIDLNSLIEEDSEWILTMANDINNAGQIVGYGINPSGDYHAFLLTPISIPEPLSLSLLGASLVFLLRKKYLK